MIRLREIKKQMVIEIIVAYSICAMSLLATGIMSLFLFKAKRKVKSSKVRYGELMYLKKSSETRIGLVGEQLAPYLSEWPFDDPRQFRLISSPIDGINFGPDEITIVEIKTGKSKLSKNQRRIKELVRQGKVSYIEFRVGEDGCEVKKTERGSRGGSRPPAV